MSLKASSNEAVKRLLQCVEVLSHSLQHVAADVLSVAGDAGEQSSDSEPLFKVHSHKVGALADLLQIVVKVSENGADARFTCVSAPVMWPHLGSPQQPAVNDSVLIVRRYCGLLAAPLAESLVEVGLPFVGQTLCLMYSLKSASAEGASSRIN